MTSWTVDDLDLIDFHPTINGAWVFEYQTSAGGECAARVRVAGNDVEILWPVAAVVPGAYPRLYRADWAKRLQQRVRMDYRKCRPFMGRLA